MTLVIPRGQTAQLGLRSDDGRPGLRGDPIQEKPDGNRGPSGFRVTSRFE